MVCVHGDNSLTKAHRLFPLNTVLQIRRGKRDNLGIIFHITVMCLSIGTPKNNQFSICSKWKINYFRCPKTWTYSSLIIMCLNIGIPKNHHFPFVTNGKVVLLGVLILLKHFRVLL